MHVQLVVLLWAVLAAIHPTAPTTGYALGVVEAIAQVAERDPAPAGWTPEMGAAVLAVTAYEEGRFCRKCVRGDNGRSATTWQVHVWSDDDAKMLEANPVAAARRAYFVVREGARICPDAPLAPYAGGCKVKLAREISRRRMAAAQGALDAARMAIAGAP